MPGTPREAFFLRVAGVSHEIRALLPYVPLTRAEHLRYLAAMKLGKGRMTFGEFVALFAEKQWMDILCDAVHDHRTKRNVQVILDRVPPPPKKVRKP